MKLSVDLRTQKTSGSSSTSDTLFTDRVRRVFSNLSLPRAYITFQTSIFQAGQVSLSDYMYLYTNVAYICIGDIYTQILRTFTVRPQEICYAEALPLPPRQKNVTRNIVYGRPLMLYVFVSGFISKAAQVVTVKLYQLHCAMCCFGHCITFSSAIGSTGRSQSTAPPTRRSSLRSTPTRSCRRCAHSLRFISQESLLTQKILEEILA